MVPVVFVYKMYSNIHLSESRFAAVKEGAVYW